MPAERIVEYLESRRDENLEEVKRALRIPSISADPASAGDVRRCAEHIAGFLRDAGMPVVEIHETAGHPIVYSEWLNAPGAPTVMIYGHYDVQPVDPLDQWVSPPFEPEVREGNLYGRGSVDDKGQLFIHLLTVAAYLKQESALPINVKLVIEGEEEIGSEHLMPYIREQKERLGSDVIVISDTTMFAPGLPSLGYGLRGISYAEVRTRSSDTDLHSGAFGGAVPNPLNALCEIVGKLKHSDGVIAIPGFYDDVLPVTDDERRRYAALPFDEADFRKAAGVEATPGEAGYSILERLWARPTLDLNGIVGGWTGPGAKTIIPAQATAKISMRLVPNQDPDKTFDQFAAYVQSLAPDGVTVEVENLHGGNAFICPVDDPAFAAAERALERGFGRSVARIREGGSIPFVPDVSKELGIPAVLMGFGLPDENAHAPNERLNLENFYGGLRAVAYLYEELRSA